MPDALTRVGGAEGETEGSGAAAQPVRVEQNGVARAESTCGPITALI